MLRDASFEATTSDYACLLRALLLSKDLASVTEVLQEMGRQGLSFTHEVYDEWGRNSTTEVHTRQFIQFRSLLVDSIAGTREERWHRSESDLEQGRAMLDGLYYALVENARAASTEHAAGGSAPPPVPRIILDALVEAAGALNLPERAFAVFQEYEPLFKVVPDVSSYNALLAACAAQRQINISVIFSIFQEMEGKVAPNRESFDILLYAMGVCKSFEIYEQVNFLPLHASPYCRTEGSYYLFYFIFSAGVGAHDIHECTCIAHCAEQRSGEPGPHRRALEASAAGHEPAGGTARQSARRLPHPALGGSTDRRERPVGGSAKVQGGSVPHSCESGPTPHGDEDGAGDSPQGILLRSG